MPDRPLITLLCPLLSSNQMIRTYELIELLRADFRLQIVGRGRMEELWPPLRDVLDVECRAYEMRRSEMRRRARSLCRELIEGDLVLAVGLRPESYGLGLVARSTLKRPLVLDNHEWDMAYLRPLRVILRRSGWRTIPALQERLTQWLVDKSSSRADAMFVTNVFLQRRYGGFWLPHVRNARTFEPRSERSREPGRPITVMFLGTARPFSGLADLMEAWRGVEGPDLRLRVIGNVRPEELLQELIGRADQRVSFEGPIALDRVPSTLAEADVVVIPQLPGRETIGQLPSKMIEAMAMGRAIVATEVGDAPIWLARGAGILVPSGAPARMADAISSLVTSPGLRADLGRRARERFLRLGSVETHRERVVDLLRGLLEGRGRPDAWPTLTELAEAA